MNNAIRAREVRVVAPDGSQVGVKKIEEALWLADQLGLDLVEVAPDAKPPVCRMMDYGKYKYEQSVKQREARKKQTRTVIKEVRLRPRIGEHDFQIVRRRAQEFLSEGDKVKVTVRFRGRENERPELGHRLAERLFEELQDLAIVEQSARKDGRTMTMVMAPTRKALDLAAAAKEGKPSHKPTGRGHKEVVPVVDEVVDDEVDLVVDEVVDDEVDLVVDEVVDDELDDAIDESDTDAAGDGD
ncbi:MAG: translation initiation factor IF-3 [Acidimicrobiia bacterium]|nr:translation initiation factor IF-3 [Acidimicrobiia bacterium]